MKLFQNKFFIICLCVALVLTVVPSTFALMGYGRLSKNIIGTLTYPFRWCFSALAEGFEGWGMYFQGIDTLRERNEALKEENKALRDRLDRAELLEQENERLREYLEIKNAHPSFEMVEGTVISYSAGNYMTTFTLNRGTAHGVAVNMPVITADGLVGKVTEVGLNWCMVSTLIEYSTEAEISFGVYLPRTGLVGATVGDYSMRYEGLCRIRYLQKTDKTDIKIGEDIRVGDLVYTSGQGGTYPADLVVGHVTQVGIDEGTGMTVASVKPSAELESLTWMMIVTGYETSAP